MQLQRALTLAPSRLHLERMHNAIRGLCFSNRHVSNLMLLKDGLGVAFSFKLSSSIYGGVGIVTKSKNFNT